jgi:arylformamidase
MVDRWIDISVSLHTGMAHWPGNPPISIERVMDVRKGDSHTLSRICMGSHTGTHVDAPGHFLPDGKSIDQMPLTSVIGEARVIAIQDPESIKPEELDPYRIRKGERILFKTLNSSRAWQSSDFVEDFVFISQKAAEYLAERRVSAVGIDYLSTGGFKGGGKAIHETLLGAGIWLIEGLDLSQVNPGKYYLICLPLKIDEGDGAPARAVLRPVQSRKKASR